MKKLILAAAIAFSTIVCSSCTKEHVTPSSKAIKLATGDKGNLLQADFISDPDATTPPAISDKGNLSQADGDGGH
jgi:hypothetical protein